MLLLTSCNTDTDTSPSEKKLPAVQDKAAKEAKWVPVALKEGIFERVYGWIDNESIAYSAEIYGQHEIRSYNLHNGSSRKIFSSTEPIIDVLVHPDGKMIFIHTSANARTAKIYFTDLEGKLLFTKDIDSHELAYAWNEQDDSSMILTAFFEDWSFEAFLLDIPNERAEPVDLPQPFVKWLGKDTIVEQDWQDGEEASAPLVRRRIPQFEESGILIADTYRYDVSGSTLLAIRAPEGEGGSLQYEFYKSGELFSSFPMKAIEDFSGWMVPYYAFGSSGKTFYTFYPVDGDPATSSYQLRSYNVGKKDEMAILFDNLEPRPLQCSRDGDACLYGYSLEQLLDLRKKEIIPLFPGTSAK